VNAAVAAKTAYGCVCGGSDVDGSLSWVMKAAHKGSCGKGEFRQGKPARNSVGGRGRMDACGDGLEKPAGTRPDARNLSYWVRDRCMWRNRAAAPEAARIRKLSLVDIGQGFCGVRNLYFSIRYVRPGCSKLDLWIQGLKRLDSRRNNPGQ
jgi:hypothetical protein